MENAKLIFVIMAMLLLSVPALTVFAQDTDVEPPEPNCPDDQVVEDGECVEPPEPNCPDDQVVEDGECVEPPEPPTQCDPACTPPTPTPQPTPAPTNPDGLIEEQPAAPSEPCEVWNIVGQDQNQCKFKIRGKVEVSTKDRGLIPISHLYVEVCGEKPTKAHLMCGMSQAIDYTDAFGRFEIDLPADEYKDITHVVLRSINEDKTLVVTHPTIAANDKPAVITAKKPSPAFSPSPGVEEINMVFYTPLSKQSTNAKSFLQINSKDVDYPDWYTNNVPADQVSDLLLVHHYTSQSLIYATTTLKVPIGTSAVTKSLALQVFSAVGSRTSYSTPSVPIIYVEVADSTFDSTDKKTIGYHFFVLFHELGHFIDYAATSGQTMGTSRGLHPVFGGGTGNCHMGYGQIDSSCAFSEGRATFVGFLLKDNVLNDGRHAYYQKLLTYQITAARTVNLKDFTHIVGPRMKSPNIVFRLDFLAEEMAYSSLLWSLYDNAPGGGENIAIHPKIITDHAFLSKTVTDFYQRIVGGGVKLVSLQSLFAKYGICTDTNRDGICSVGSRGDTIDGKSAWKTVRYGLNTFGYPQGRP